MFDRLYFVPNRNFVFLVVLVVSLALIFALAVPALAQEVTDPAPIETVVPTAFTPTVTIVPTDVPVPDVPPDVDTVQIPGGVFIVVVVVAGVLLTVFMGFVHRTSVAGLKLIPAFLRPPIYVTIDSLLAELERRAKETVDTADDEQLLKFRNEWNRIKQEVDGTITQALRVPKPR